MIIFDVVGHVWELLISLSDDSLMDFIGLNK